MKKYNIIPYLLSISAVVLLFACKKSYFYDGINDDPTQLKNPTPSLLLPPIIRASAYEYGGDESRFPAIFMQQVTGAANQSYSANLYNVSPDDVNNMWTFGFYVGIMNNTHDLIKLSASLNQKYYHAIGQILMANALQRTTDLWGDIPYSKAFLGEASKNADFDSQETIYKTIFTLLNNSIAEINAGDNGVNVPGGDDNIYGGDMDQWAKFAHAMKARSFLHLVKQNAAYYDSVIKEIPLALASASDNVKVPFSGSSVTASNPTFQFDDQRGDISYKGKLQDMLVAAGDPRYSLYFNTKDNTLLGALFGSANSPIYLMTFDELKFIEAEAQFQKGNKTAAALAYNDAVTANLARTGAAAGYASSVSKTGSTIALADIITQKYIALFLSAEVWTDWRRTGLPALTAPSGNLTGGTIPRALLYPSDEVRYNSKTPAGRTLISKVWWDK
jgi:hypothetical protein